jgi:hypothetical protein
MKQEQGQQAGAGIIGHISFDQWFLPLFVLLSGFALAG